MAKKIISEFDIQQYIWKNKDNWETLVEEITFPEKFTFHTNENDINQLSPDKLVFNELIDRLKETHGLLKGLQLFGCEVPLKKDGDSTIRADLLGLREGVSGIVIIEIKKSSQTERQAYTELLAYAAHLQGIFPTISKDDITYVLIAPMQERIVREATIHSFLFDEKPVFAYIPSWENDDITTLKLKPWIPESRDFVHVRKSIFSQKNFEVFKLTWDRIDGWNAKKGENPSPYMIERMNKMTSYSAQCMEAKGIHGFVFTSQLYPESPLLQNALIIVGINPFKVSKDFFLIQQNVSPFDLGKIPDGAVNLLDIIPELGNKAQALHEEKSYLKDLIMTWPNTITKIAFDTYKVMTTNNKGYSCQRSWGGMTWEEYQQRMIEDALCFNYSIKSTGLIRKLFTAYSIEDYEYLANHGYQNHPSLNHGDIPMYLVDYLDQQSYFRDFLLRLFDSDYEIRDELEESESEI